MFLVIDKRPIMSELMSAIQYVFSISFDCEMKRSLKKRNGSNLLHFGVIVPIACSCYCLGRNGMIVFFVIKLLHEISTNAIFE